MPNQPPASLTTSTRYAYAQTLASRIYRNDWHDPSTQLDYGEDIPFKVLGGGMIPTPLILQATHHGHERAAIPPARITISNPAYMQVVIDLLPPQADAWLDWLQPRFDAHGHAATPSRLFRLNGDKWSRNIEHTDVDAQDAALAILDVATVRHLLDTETPSDP